MHLANPSQQQLTEITKDPFQKIHKLRSELRTAFANLNRIAVEAIRRETASSSDGSVDSTTEENQPPSEIIRISLDNFLNICDELESALQTIIEAEKFNSQIAKTFPQMNYRPLMDPKVDTSADPKLTHEFQLFVQQQTEIMKSLKVNLAETLAAFSGKKKQTMPEVAAVSSEENQPQSMPIPESSIKTDAIVDDEIVSMEVVSDQVQADDNPLLQHEENPNETVEENLIPEVQQIPEAEVSLPPKQEAIESHLQSEPNEIQSEMMEIGMEEGTAEDSLPLD